MAQAFLSTLWYRIADLAPRLPIHVTVGRHRYRGRPWYVMHHHASGRVHRFSPAAYQIIGQFDGKRTVNDIWQSLADTYDEEAPSQDDVIQLLSNLHQNDLIQYASAPHIDDLVERHRKQSSQLLKQNLTNPMSLRLPLWDPDPFLTRTLPAVRWALGWGALALWLVVVGWGATVAWMNWDLLTADFAAQMLGTQNLMISLISYPLLKALHELMHGYLAKKRGAEIREMGIMFLVFFPVPYVDASAAAGFRSKWDRAAVSAGGIIVELFCAALAVFVWMNAEPGLTRAVAYNIIMIGGLSTVVVNGNPLLKFDGYYVLSDLIEIPNLAQRSTRWWGWVIQRRLFGAKQLKRRHATRGEQVWFALYAPTAFVYRMIVMLGIALFVAGRFFVVGILLACWSLFNTIVKPMAKHLSHVVTSPGLRKVRRRANTITFGGIAALVLVALLIPLPLRTDSLGIVWLPDEAHVRLGTAGQVTTVFRARGERVSPNTPLLHLEDATLAARLDYLGWRVEEERRRITAAEATDRAAAEQYRQRLAAVEAELDRERRRASDLTAYAAVEGVFEPVMPTADMEGRFFAQGDLVGYVLPDRASVIRVVVGQDDATLVRDRLRSAEVMLAGRMGESHSASAVRDVPAATLELPSTAFSTAAGGRFLTDPSDPEGITSLEPVFLLDLAAPEALQTAPFGSRVYVRFDLGTEPAGLQIWRRLRQLFLRQLGA